MTAELLITLIFLVIVLIAILYIISIWVYKRAPANMGFIRTGYLGTRVCLGRGAMVLPVFHEVTWVSLETLKLIVSRSRDQAVLTSDKIRIDVVAELYAHVGRSEEDLLAAARSLGERTFDTEKVRNLLEAKIVSALRSFAATKTLSELHENRDAFAKAVQNSVVESFHANGLTLEEVTIVTLEQSGKEFFDKDNVFDAEGLKVITAITSDARRQVHNTEKRTTVSIRQRELDTQLELLEIEKQEAFARAHQDREVANEQAQQIGNKQMYVLDQRMAVEQKEIDNERALERMRAERDVNATEESRRREAAEIQKTLELEKARRDREIELVAKTEEEQIANIQRKLAEERAERDRRIALVDKAKEEELVEIARELAREQARKDKEIELIAKEQARQVADIDRTTVVMGREESARDERHKSSEETALSVRRRSLETRLAMLDIDKDEAFAQTQQEREVANERARVLSEQQRFILEQRWQVEEEEIAKAQALESAQIRKDIAIVEETRKREAAEIQRGLARETEERNRDIALVAKAGELEQAEVQRRLAVEVEERTREVALTGKDEEVERARVRKALAVEVEERTREVALTGKDEEVERARVKKTLAVEVEEREREVTLTGKEEEVERARVKKALAVEVEERERDIALIAKEQERERADIQRFLAREQEERDRQIALAAKTRELEQAEAHRLEMTARREQAEHDAESVRRVADATRQKEIDRIRAEKDADTRRIDEENKAQITRMHLLTQAESRSLAAEREAEATLTRARATSEAQQIAADGIEREAGAVGRAEVHIEALRVENVQRRFQAEAVGIEAKADALKKYNESATFLELAKLHIEAERDVHIDQAKAMGTALTGAHIRMYGGDGGTVDNIRQLFTSGFGIGEALEGVAQSLPEGLRDRLARDGIRGIFRRPDDGPLSGHVGHIQTLVDTHLGDALDTPFAAALERLNEAAGGDEQASRALAVLDSVNDSGAFDDVPFATAWNLLQSLAKSSR
ncbi:MAG: SPFH domain-containing protein [Thiotrichales bacterium]|nr:SPFH domain-containing protein [Thiotrichales bacterium]